MLTLKRCLIMVIYFATLCSARENTCSCPGGLKHMQDLYCDADFVIKAKVTKMTQGDREYIYNINIKKVYKAKTDFEAAEKKIYISDDCWIRLEEGVTHVLAGHISGDKLRIDRCTSYMEQWQNMTSVQKRSLSKNILDMICEDTRRCRVCVQNCDDPPDELTCNLPQGEQQSCYRSQTYCRHKWLHGICKFKKTRGLEKCLEN